MKPCKVAGVRRAAGYTQKETADILGISVSSYRSKESGTTRFTDEQKAVIAKLFGLTLEQANDCLYGGGLPI
jgi:DNA-binding XRE family transcriptional regulator